MPHARRIGEIEQAIAELRDAIATLRRARPRPDELNHALGELARLKAARTRLMLKQIRSSDPPAGNEKPPR